MTDFVSYKGKRVVITGCYSGMGEATAKMLLELGAEVHGIDYQVSELPLASFTQTDLRDPAAIDRAVEALPDEIDALFNCAGVPSTFSTIDIFKVNYLGPRRLTDQLIPRIKSGGAIANISSTAAFNWHSDAERIGELLAVSSDFEKGVEWCEAQGEIDAYTFSKGTIILWTLMSSFDLVKRGLRMNCTLPAPTETPFMDKQQTVTPTEVIDVFSIPMNRRSTPAEQASALVFLNSDAASFINGVALLVDGGFMAGVTTGRIDLASMFAKS